jgi:hypothetical protein
MMTAAVSFQNRKQLQDGEKGTVKKIPIRYLPVRQNKKVIY